MIISKPKLKNYLTIEGETNIRIAKTEVDGKTEYERFYLINFLNIKKNTYVISTFGRVFLFDSQEQLPVNRINNDHHYINLRLDNGNSKKFLIHTLVAYAFIPHTPDDIKLKRKYIHHKNWVNKDVYSWNLEWRNRTEISYMTKLRDNDYTCEQLKEIAIKLLRNRIPSGEISKILDNKITNEEIRKLKRHCI